MATNLWLEYPKHKPAKSGEYLVVVNMRKFGRNQPLVMLNEYDPERQSFSFDELMVKRKHPERVYAWIDFKQPPKYWEIDNSQEVTYDND